jgi:Na+/H+ antiporter NhaD/arsenite permease-like protein
VSTEAITEESMSDALGGQLFLWLITTAGIAILFSSLGTDMPGLASSIGNLPTYALWSYGLLSFLRFVLEGGIELR